MKLCTDVVTSKNTSKSLVEYPKIGSNKTADERSCEVGPTGGAPWWPKSEQSGVIRKPCYNSENRNFLTFKTCNF
jgi:hypothetical protein